ncbi:unnamed protein product [Arabidopsis thaliana]|uniref:(thale cress) hypothetical protein n=1 Tax=Arabidopsis thaliana TaxID=3702 RepID=A0A7G2EBM4_ARATH|nr:unnamed protein product [Arabidopsis thaliana]
MVLISKEIGGNSEIDEDSSKLHQNVSDSLMEDNVDRVPSPTHQPEQGILDGGNFEELLPQLKQILSEPGIDKMSDDVSSLSHQDVAKGVGGNREEEVVAPESQQLEEYRIKLPQSPEDKVRQEVAFERTEYGKPNDETICGDGEEVLKEAKTPRVVDEAVEDTTLPGLVPPRFVEAFDDEANLSDPSSPTVVVSKVLTELKTSSVVDLMSTIYFVQLPQKDDVLEENVSQILEKVVVPVETVKKDEVVEGGVSQTEAIVAPGNENEKKNAGPEVLVKAGDLPYNRLEKIDGAKFQMLCNIMEGEQRTGSI